MGWFIKLRNAGFSLTEVLIVIALLAILAGFALPPYFEWRQNLTYRQSANEIATALKIAKSKTITTNLQHKVALDSAARSYQTAVGDGAYRSSTWATAGLGGTLQPGVFLNLSGAATLNIQFNPNGTTDNNFNIRIMDNTATRYNVAVERSGRIRMSRQ